MHLRELLAGFEPRPPQSVDNMTVIPLICTETEFRGIGGAENVALAKDTDYNSLHLEPIEQKLTIVPNGFTYLTKESAQDRTVPRTQVLTTTSEVQAYCVQSRQHGNMQAKNADQREVRLLPLAIKHHAFSIAPTSRQCGGLWGKLGAYNDRLGVQGDYLVSLFTQYQAQLEAFVAHFEPLPAQRGAIVLINGRVAGIDIFPSHAAYLGIWEKLIRDSYGTEAIYAKSEFRVSQLFPLEEPTKLEDLTRVVSAQAAAERDWAYGIVTECLNQTVTLTKTSQHRDRNSELYKLSVLESEELEGEVVYAASSQQAAYLSLFRRAEIAQKTVKAFSL
jgi:hypothetical protein